MALDTCFFGRGVPWLFLQESDKHRSWGRCLAVVSPGESHMYNMILSDMYVLLIGFFLMFFIYIVNVKENTKWITSQPVKVLLLIIKLKLYISILSKINLGYLQNNQLQNTCVYTH